MSYMLFVDESGHDRRKSPYEVLAGIAIEDKKIWPLVSALAKLQESAFGVRLFEAYGEEAKAVKLLKKKVFKHAAQMSALPIRLRQRQAHGLLLRKGSEPTKSELTALAQAKLDYCKNALSLAYDYGGCAFASIIPQNIERPKRKDMLRKDYNFLFERFFYLLEMRSDKPMGYIVFDEIEKSASHILLGQIKQYFTKTQKGQKRARSIIPEALFVHSDLTTLIQIADLIAYIISWTFCENRTKCPARPELVNLMQQALRLQLYQKKPDGTKNTGFRFIHDLGQ